MFLEICVSILKNKVNPHSLIHTYFKGNLEMVKSWCPHFFFYNFGKSKVTFYTYLTFLVIGKSIIFKFNPKNFIEYQLFFYIDSNLQNLEKILCPIEIDVAISNAMANVLVVLRLISTWTREGIDPYINMGFLYLTIDKQKNFAI